MTPAEILNKAADVIERNGWWQGSYSGPLKVGQNISDAPVCALGAINLAAGDRPGRLYDPAVGSEAYTAACALADSLGLPRHLPLGVTVGDRWNDAEGRTVEQVVAALREAARTAGSAS